MPQRRPRRSYVGIDPGQSGGLALLCQSGTVVCIKMPATEVGIWEWISDVVGSRLGEVVAILEQVHSMPKDGKASAFKFGKGYGGLRMALIASGLREGSGFQLVTPQAWQASYAPTLSFRKKHREGRKTVYDESKSQYKTRLWELAQSLFPQTKILKPAADALLLAEYGRRKYED